MPPVPPHIPLAGWDVERRRLETTLEGDLSTLSLSSMPTVNSHASGGSAGLSFISASSVEIPRSAMPPMTSRPPSAWPSGVDDSFIAGAAPGPSGPSSTPRAAARRSRAYDAPSIRHPSAASAMSMNSLTSMAESPKSTEGHHVSAMTLGGGIFRRPGADLDDGSDFDPDRSLGRLVGELGRVMHGNLAPRPASPFAHALSPPRSPSPLPSQASRENGLNLSLTLARSDALPSPPDSRGSRDSNAADDTVRGAAQSSAGFTTIARQLKEDLRAQESNPRSNSSPRRALSDSTTFNIVHATPARSAKSGKSRAQASSAAQATSQHLKPPRAQQHSAPAGRSGRRADLTSDVTGMSGLMATPAKGCAYDSLSRNGDVGDGAAGDIPQTLATLHARLRGLETEGSLARRRVRELEGELDQARAEVENTKSSGGARLHEVVGEKSALEELVASLRFNLARLTAELESNKALVLELQTAQEVQRNHPPTPVRPGTADELVALRREIERLSIEIKRLGGIVEQGLETRRRTREERTERTVRIDETVADAEPSLIQLDNPAPAPVQSEAQPSRLRQGLHTSAAATPTLMPPTAQPSTRLQATTAPRRPSPLAREAHGSSSRSERQQISSRRVSGGSTSDDGSGSGSNSNSNRSESSRRRTSRPRTDGPSSPFPTIRAEDEADFFAQLEAPTTVRSKASRMRGNSRRDEGVESVTAAPGKKTPRQSVAADRGEGEKRIAADAFGAAPLPPQTVLARVIAELEDDYAHYRSIYGELAEQYKVLDASGAANKRAILAQHLKEVIDTLEQKAGQIQALYSLLHFQDRPLDPRSTRQPVRAHVKGAPRDVLRMVRETLGDDAVRRLEEDGVTMGRRRSARLI